MSQDDATNQVSDLSPTFEAPVLTSDANVRNVCVESNTFSEQWGFVDNPQFSVDHFAHTRETSTSTQLNQQKYFNNLQDVSPKSSSYQLFPKAKHVAPASCDINLSEFDGYRDLTDSWVGVDNQRRPLKNDYAEQEQLKMISTDSELKTQSLPFDSPTHEKVATSSKGSSSSKDDSDLDWYLTDEQSGKLTNSVKSMWNNFKNGNKLFS